MISKKDKEARDAMREHMKSYLKPGDRIFVAVKKVGQNGYRHMRPYYYEKVAENLYCFWADARIAFGSGDPAKVKYDELRLQMNSRELVEYLGEILYGDRTTFKCTEV